MSRTSSFKSIEDHLSPGGGGRGPQPPQPFGGGGGGGRGDGDDTPSQGERLQKYRMGLYFVIGSIMMLFVSCSSLFILERQANEGFDPTAVKQPAMWMSTPLPMKLLLFNSALLLLSTLAAEMARRSAMLEAILLPIGDIPGVAAIKPKSLLWTRTTAALGFGFLAGQAVVWTRLHEWSVNMNNPLSSAFIIILTGGHALHLFGGLAVLLYISFSERMRRKYESRRIAVDLTTWYWHFMGVMWVYVMGVLLFVH